MAPEFKEKFNKDYWEFLKFVWNFEKNNVPDIERLIQSRNPECEQVIIRNQRDKRLLLNRLEDDAD